MQFEMSVFLAAKLMKLAVALDLPTPELVIAKLKGKQTAEIQPHSTRTHQKIGRPLDRLGQNFPEFAHRLASGQEGGGCRGKAEERISGSKVPPTAQH